MRMLHVKWRDIESKHLGWVALADMEKEQAPVAEIMGWELRRDNGELQIVSCVCADEGSLLTTIPLGCVIEERELS